MGTSSDYAISVIRDGGSPQPTAVFVLDELLVKANQQITLGWHRSSPPQGHGPSIPARALVAGRSPTRSSRVHPVGWWCDRCRSWRVFLAWLEPAAFRAADAGETTPYPPAAEFIALRRAEFITTTTTKACRVCFYILRRVT